MSPGRQRSRSPGRYHRRSSRSRSRTPPARNFTAMGKDGASAQERRIYVGNLPYSVRWQDLKDYMKDGKFASHLENEHVC